MVVVDCIFRLLAFHEIPFTDVFCSIPLQKEFSLSTSWKTAFILQVPITGFRYIFFLRLMCFFQILNFYSEEQYWQYRNAEYFNSEDYLKTKSIHFLPRVNKVNKKLTVRDLLWNLKLLIHSDTKFLSFMEILIYTTEFSCLMSAFIPLAH